MLSESVDREVAHLVAGGSRRVSLRAFDAELRLIGYRLERSSDCKSLNRYVTGERAGESYPAVNMYTVQVSDGVSAFHVDSRRDANFERLQEMRRNEELFAVHKGRIYKI